MKKIRLKLAAIVLLAAMAGCNNPDSKTTINNSQDETSINLKDDNTSMQIKHSGTIKLNDNETAIVSISPGGYLRYTNNGRELSAKGEDNNTITYALRENGGQLNAQDAAGQRFIAQTLREMHSYGYNLASRRDALYQAGGYKAVLNEIASLKSDDMKKSSLEYLLSKIKPENTEEFTAVLNAADAIKSDNAKARLLDKVTNMDGKSEAQWIAEIESASRINATAEKTNLMADIGQKMPKSDAVKDAYMKAAKTISAETEYRRVISIIK